MDISNSALVSMDNFFKYLDGIIIRSIINKDKFNIFQCLLKKTRSTPFYKNLPRYTSV